MSFFFNVALDAVATVGSILFALRTMTPEQLGEIAGNCVLAVQFLTWAGLVFAPKLCPEGHRWQPREVEQKAEPKRKVVKQPKKEGCNWIFFHRPGSPNKVGRPWQTPMFQKEKQCLKKKSWRTFCPMSQYLPNSISPRKLVKILFYWSQKIPMQTVSLWLGIDRGTLREAYQVIRSYICDWLILQNQQLLRGPGLAVVIDETFITPRKKSRSIRGRTTKPQQTCIFGAVEIDVNTRKQTGRCYLRYIANRKAETLKHLVQSTIAAGTPIWTDDFPSYDWLESYGYPHARVNHSAGEVVTERKEGTNAIEGMFSRCKKFLKTQNTRMPSKGSYGLLLAEFVWRVAALGAHSVPERKWPLVAFWRLLSCLREVEARRARGEQELSECWQTPKEFSYLIPTNIAASGFDEPLTADQVSSCQLFTFGGRAMTSEESSLVQEGAQILYSQEPHPVLDLGPAPKKRPGRPPGRGRGGLRGRRGRPRKILAQCIDLDPSEEEGEPSPAPLPPPHQVCDRCDKAHATGLCPHFPAERLDHPDALARHQRLPHCNQQDIRRLGRGLWEIAGTTFEVGTASGEANNCLISTFCQLLHQPTEHASVRELLRRACPQHVEAANFLEVNAVWRPLLEALDQEPANYQIICLNNIFSQNGVVLGDGPTRLCILNQGNAHFVPLWPRD